MVGTDFYTTSAQIIPVLLLTLILERGFLRREKGQSPISALWWLTLVTATLVLGEAAALAGAAGATGKGYARMTVIAIGTGGFAIVFSYLIDHMTAALAAVKKRPKRQPKGAVVATPLTVVATVVTAFAPLALALWVAYFVL